MTTRALRRREQAAAAAAERTAERTVVDIVAILQELVLQHLPPPALFKFRGVCKSLRDYSTDAIQALPRPIVLGGAPSEYQAFVNDGHRYSSVLRLSWLEMQWESMPTMQLAHGGAPLLACALNDGTLIAISCWAELEWVTKAEMLAPNSEHWQPLPVPILHRPEAVFTALPGRRALLCGGERTERPPLVGTTNAYVLDLDAEGGPAWSEVEPMRDPRHGHSAVTLPSGHIIVSGGMGDGTVGDYSHPCECKGMQTL